jgi:hypothetical protein
VRGVQENKDIGARAKEKAASSCRWLSKKRTSMPICLDTKTEP